MGEIKSTADCLDRMLILVRYRPGIWASELRRAIPETENENFNEAVRLLRDHPGVRTEKDGQKVRHYIEGTP